VRQFHDQLQTADGEGKKKKCRRSLSRRESWASLNKGEKKNIQKRRRSSAAWFAHARQGKTLCWMSIGRRVPQTADGRGRKKKEASVPTLGKRNTEKEKASNSLDGEKMHRVGLVKENSGPLPNRYGTRKGKRGDPSTRLSLQKAKYVTRREIRKKVCLLSR